MDLVATKGDERIAIEVETGKSDTKKNIKKCKEAGFGKVFVVQIQGDKKIILVLILKE